MSEFKNLINYLKIARRSKELEENTTNVLANILDENSATAVESIEKAQLNNPQLYKVLDEELEFHSMLYLSVENNERVYYKRFLIYNPIGEPFIKYRKLFEMPLLTLTDTNFIPIRIEANQGYYYDNVNNRVIGLHLEQVFPLSDFCEYHPEELSGVTNGEHRFDYKDEKGNNNAWDIAFSPIFKDYRLNRRVVDFEKKMTAGYLYLFPLITKESSESYVLNYYYRKKGDLIHFLEEESSPAITLRFSYIGSCLAFLNHTIFYFMDTDDGFETAIRKKFFSQYKKMVYDKLNSLQNLPLADTLEILYFIPRGLLSIINKEFLWSTAEKAIDGTLTNMGTDSEDIILTILTALSTKETADEFLNRFLKVRRGKKTLFALLYEKMNGTNFVKLIKLFRKIWLTSSFIDISNKVFSKSDGPLLLPYKSDKFIGFFGSNKNFDFLSNDFIEVTADDHWIDELGSVIHKEIGDGLNELFEDQTKFKYHPFQPIYLTEVIKESPLELPKLLPAFFLKANEDKSFWSNVITAVEYTADVVTTLSGVGNLAKFRYLARLGEAGSLIAKIKLGAGIVEITSGVTNTLLKLTGLNDTEAGKALQEYLFYLELLSLSGELTASIKKGLQKSAKEVLEHSDDLERQLDGLIKNGELDEAGKQGLIDELNEVAELDYLTKWDDLPISGKGYLGGKTLRRKEIKFWIDEINRISNGKSKLIVLSKGDIILNGNKAGFNPYNGNIYVEKGLTEYEIFHEFKHLEEFTLIGKDKYIEGMKRSGGSPTDDVIRTYKREKYVFDEVMENKNRFNAKQLKNAEWIINTAIEDCIKAGIDITKIK